MEIDLINLAIINDLLGQELNDIPYKDILDGKLKCKLKNAIKSSNSLTSYFDELFEMKSVNAEYFGEICDLLKVAVDNFIKDYKNEYNKRKTADIQSSEKKTED